MLDRLRPLVAPRPHLAARAVVLAHLVVLAGVGSALAHAHARWAQIGGAILLGTSWFALTGLIPESSHRHPPRRRGWADALGLLAGWSILTPLAARRAFFAAHHRATNGVGDPHRPLNSRWMLLIGAPVSLAVIHWHAIRTLRGRAFAAYLVETAVMGVTLGLILTLLPQALRDRAVLLPLVVAAAWQNLRIVSEHLDRPSGRFRDTWQLALPAPVSRWLLHCDHHLEHHLRPGLRWHELPVYRAEINRGGFIPRPQQVTASKFAREVFARRRPTPRVAEPIPAAPPLRWAGRAAIRARPRQPNHPTRESIN